MTTTKLELYNQKYIYSSFTGQEIMFVNDSSEILWTMEELGPGAGEFAFLDDLRDMNCLLKTGERMPLNTFLSSHNFSDDAVKELVTDCFSVAENAPLQLLSSVQAVTYKYGEAGEIQVETDTESGTCEAWLRRKNSGTKDLVLAANLNEISSHEFMRRVMQKLKEDI